MYEDISRERKEKDRIKRRAYVRMVTNLGGSLNLELFCDKVCRALRTLRYRKLTGGLCRHRKRVTTS